MTSADIVNQAIYIIGDKQPLVTGVAPTFDSSPAGKAASVWYQPVVATVGRQFGWDFARNSFALVPTGNTAPFPWSFEYAYPTNGIQVWQLKPASLADANNPLPINWSTGNTLVSSTQTKVIWTNLASALAVYNNNPNENTWDPLFRESVVRLLGSVLAMALAGKPDSAQSLLESGGAFESLGEKRDS